MFDKITIALGSNTTKAAYFPLEQRIQWIQDVFADEQKVEVLSYEGLTVDFCVQQEARFILRGLRTSSDFEYERAIAQMNRTMHEHIETFFLLTQPEHTHVTSTIVREVIRYGGDASKFLPSAIKL